LIILVFCLDVERLSYGLSHKKHLEELKVLKEAKPNLRKNILKAADATLIQFLCECLASRVIADSINR
jgi:hypothetical protein